MSAELSVFAALPSCWLFFASVGFSDCTSSVPKFELLSACSCLRLTSLGSFPALDLTALGAFLLATCSGFFS